MLIGRMQGSSTKAAKNLFSFPVRSIALFLLLFVLIIHSFVFVYFQPYPTGIIRNEVKRGGISRDSSDGEETIARK